MRRTHHTTWGRGAGIGAYGQSAHGFALITTLLLLLLTTSVTTAITVGGLQNRVSGNLQNGLQATYLAEAGMQHASYQLRRDSQWRAGIVGTPLGHGTYLVTVTQPIPTADISLMTTGQVAGAQRTLTETLRYEILTIAGTGSQGFSGDGGAATAARRLSTASPVLVVEIGYCYSMAFIEPLVKPRRSGRCDQEVHNRTRVTPHKVCEEVSKKETRNHCEPGDVQVSLPRRADESSEVRSSGDNVPVPASLDAETDEGRPGRLNAREASL